MPMLSADFVPFISAPEASICVGRITDKIELSAAGEGVESGRLEIEIINVLSSAELAEGDRILVPYERMRDFLTRKRNRFNHWNNLELERGKLLLVICRPIPESDLWQAGAADAVEAVDDSLVTDMKTCLAIEQIEPDDIKKIEQTRAALISQRHLVTYYALDCIGRRKLFPRRTGLDMLAGALDSPRLKPVDKTAMADPMADYLFEAEQAVEPVNTGIIATMAGALIKADDPEVKFAWVQQLGACIFDEFADDPKQDRVLQAALIKSVKDPAGEKFIQQLKALKKGVDKDDQEVVDNVLKAWLAAAKAD